MTPPAEADGIARINSTETPNQADLQEEILDPKDIGAVAEEGAEEEVKPDAKTDGLDLGLVHLDPTHRGPALHHPMEVQDLLAVTLSLLRLPTVQLTVVCTEVPTNLHQDQLILGGTKMELPPLHQDGLNIPELPVHLVNKETREEVILSLFGHQWTREDAEDVGLDFTMLRPVIDIHNTVKLCVESV